MKLTRKPVLLSVLAVAALALAFGLYWFAPWKLLTSTTVNEAAPVVAASSPAASPAASPAVAAPSASPVAVLLAEGRIVTHEHKSSGTAQLVRLPGGGHQLILRDLSTSDGPDLRVWLTDQRVLTGEKGWYVFDDGRHVELGRLKGNKGTQVYDLPPGTDPAAFRSVTIWCVRFSVSFAAAPLDT